MATEPAPQPSPDNAGDPPKPPPIKIVIAGKPVEFATAAELQEYVNKADSDRGDAVALRATIDASHRVVQGKCTDAEFLNFYTEAGCTPEKAAEYLQQVKTQNAPAADSPAEPESSAEPATRKPAARAAAEPDDGDGTEPAGIQIEELSPRLQRFMADSYQIAKGSLEVMKELNADKIETVLDKDTTVGPYWERMTPTQRDHLTEAVRKESGVKKVLDSGGLLKRNELDVAVRAAQKYCGEVHGTAESLSSKDNGSAGRPGNAPIVGAETAITSPFSDEELAKVKTDEYIELDGSPESQAKLEQQMHAVSQRQSRAERATADR